ncbi:unnamed protein product [Paramecium sonneborni]|uniref:Uncharacterized protein n=1 Tax=Paramecium sonneborni TaxID=65129 RepID=A0A8S1M5Z0_9CILI|nr:unnamed protein product [Paramecium sonneborni]
MQILEYQKIQRNQQWFKKNLQIYISQKRSSQRLRILQWRQNDIYQEYIMVDFILLIYYQIIQTIDKNSKLDVTLINLEKEILKLQEKLVKIKEIIYFLLLNLTLSVNY